MRFERDRIARNCAATSVQRTDTRCNGSRSEPSWIPAAQSGETIDPSNVNVRYLPGGMTPGATVYRVDDAAACGSSGGWYYNDPSTPTEIILCPATCTEVESDAAAKVQVEFGCASVIL